MHWDTIGEPLADLLRFERESHKGEPASFGLLSALTRDSDSSRWRRFLLEGDNLAAVVRQTIAISAQDGNNPRDTLESIEDLVTATHIRNRESADSFLATYLSNRPRFPADPMAPSAKCSVTGMRRLLRGA